LNEVLRWIGSVEIHLATVPAVAFVVVYGVFVEWRRTPMGRHLMAFMSALAAVLLLSSVGQFAFRGSLWFLLLRLVTFAAVPLVLYWRLAILIRTQVGVHRLRLSRTRRNETEEDA
jgi:hypothetical protein